MADLTSQKNITASWIDPRPSREQITFWQDIEELSPDDIAEQDNRTEQIPRETRMFLASEKTAQAIHAIGQDMKLPEERLSDIARCVYYIAAGIITPETIERDVALFMHLSPEQNTAIANRIRALFNT